MRYRMLLLLVLTTTIASAQWTQSGSKIRYTNGTAIGCRDTANYTHASDTGIITRQCSDGKFYSKGSAGSYWKHVGYDATDFIRNQIGSNLSAQSGKYQIDDSALARIFVSAKGYFDSVQARGSGGGALYTNGGVPVMHWGGGGSVEVDFKGFAGYDANRSSSYTNRSFTDKGYVDSIRTVIGDSLNTRVRLQTGSAAFQQVGKIRISDSIRTAGVVRADEVYADGLLSGVSGAFLATGDGIIVSTTGAAAASVNMKQGSTPFVSGQGYTSIYPVNTDSLGIAFYRGAFLNSTAILSADNIPNGTTRTYTLPNASGTIALTSNINDSASALRSSINTKLNISDAATMLDGYLPLTGGTLTGALSGTSATFSDSIRAAGARFTLGIRGTTGTFSGNLNTDAIMSAFSFSGQSASFNIPTNETREIAILDNTSQNKDSYIGTAFGGLFLQNNNYFDGSNYTFPNAFAPSSTITLVNGGINFQTGLTGANPTTKFNIDSTGNAFSLPIYNATVGGTNRDVFVDNTGLIGYVPSIRASKKNILPLLRPNWIHSLSPVSFHYRKKDSTGKYTDSAYKEIEYGLIAEDVEKVNPEMVFYDVDSTGKHLRGVSYSKLIIPMLKEIQEQKKTITALEARLAKLETILNVQVRKTRR
jgi:hypothetical protein